MLHSVVVIGFGENEELLLILFSIDALKVFLSYSIISLLLRTGELESEEKTVNY